MSASVQVEPEERSPACAAPRPGMRHELWTDTAAFDRGFEKAAASLAAMARVLERRHPLGVGEDEFLALYRQVRRSDPDAFTRVWTFPTAFAWSRDGYEQLGALLAASAPDDARRRALARQLDAFKGFAAAVALLAGEPLRFERPLRVRLPFALPGTGRILLGEGEAELLGVRGGELALRGEGPARLEPAPTARHAGCELELDPFALRGAGPPVPEVEDAIGFGLAFQARARGLVREALRAIERHAPESFAQLRDLVRCVALRPGSDDGTASSVSFSDLPGAFVASIVDDPYEVADTFIHELHHNRLFLLEEDGPLFPPAAQRAAAVALHYSPFRPDPRTLRGTFHGLYVTQPLGRYWLRVLASGEARGPLAGYAADAVVRAAIRSEIALRLLERHAELTPRGQAFLAELARDARALQAEARRRGLSGALPAWRCLADGSFEREEDADGRPRSVWESLRDHLSRYDAARECEGFLADLARL